MTRRQVSPYQTRIHLDYVKLYGSPDYGGPYLTCLSEGDIELIRCLLGYARRRIQWAYNLDPLPAYYEGVTDEEFEGITDKLDDLEGRLMGVVCLPELVEAIEGLGEDLQAALNCICEMARAGSTDRMYGEDLQGLIDSGQVEWSAVWENQAFGAQEDEDACAIAQLYWQATFEMMTEIVLPAARVAFDYLIPAIAALIVGFGTGGFGLLAVYAIAEMVQELLETGYEVSETNYVNWLVSVRQEWVCEAYNVLLEGGNAETVYNAVKTAVIDAAEDISTGDKIATRVFGGMLAINSALGAWSEQSQWALENVDEGFCDECPEPPDEYYQSVLPCVDEDWEEYQETSLQCIGGYPEIKNGWAIYRESVITAPSNPFWIKIDWIPRGSEATATVGFNIRFEPGNIPYSLGNDGPKPVNVETSCVWQVTADQIGKTVDLQMVQATWWGDLIGYGCYPYNPEE
jgi:hypothetical protein